MALQHARALTRPPHRPSVPANRPPASAGRTGWMPHPRPLDVVIGAPLDFDIGRVLAGAPDQEMPMDKLADAYHAQ